MTEREEGKRRRGERRREKREKREPGGRYKLAETMGEDIIDFSLLESHLGYVRSIVLFKDGNHESEGRILGDNMAFGQKVNALDMLCREKRISAVDHWREDGKISRKHVVSELRRCGTERNRLVHDEIEPSANAEVANIFRLNKKGAPDRDGWRTVVIPEDFMKIRRVFQDTDRLLADFLHSVEKHWKAGDAD